MTLTSREPELRPPVLPRQGGAVLLLFAGLASLQALRSVNRGVLTIWTFTYEHGFLKRALVGDAMARVFGAPSEALVTVLSGIIAVAAAAALLRWFAGPALRDGSVGAWLFALVAASHSATLSNVFYDLGRFDHIGLLILLGCLTSLAHGTPGLRLALVPVACAVGLLVHEAFALMFVPLIFAAWEYEEGRARRGARVVCLAGLAAFTWVIGTYGRMTELPMDEYIRHLDARQSISIVEGSVFVLYSDFQQSVSGTVGTIWDTWYLVNHVGMLVLLLPSFIFLWRLGHRVAAKEGVLGRPAKLVLAAAFTPLLLYPLGWDSSRWWAISLTNLFIALSYLWMRDGSTRALEAAIERKPVLVAAVLGLSLVAGPLGVVEPFPLFEGFWFVVHGLFYGIPAWLG